MNRDFLLRTFLQSNSLNMLTEAVSASLNCPVLITDHAFHIVSAFAANNYDSAEYRAAVAHSELPLNLCQQLADPEDTAHYRRLHSDSLDGLAAELKNAGVSLGFVLYLTDAADLPEKDCLFAESLLAKQFDLERSRGSGVSDSAEAILTELLNGQFPSEERFLARTAGTFLGHFRPAAFALLDLDDAVTEARGARRLQDVLTQHFPASHPFFYDGRFLLFLHHDHDRQLLRPLAEEYRLRGIISEPLDSLYALRSSYSLVRDTLDYLTAQKAQLFILDSRRYLLLMLLRRLSKQYPLPEPAIHALYEYDTAHKAELCLTLYTYLTCGHSLLRTCDKLFTHRNTVQYRIRKIREEFGLDTEDPDRQLGFLLSLALALLRLGHEELFIAGSV